VRDGLRRTRPVGREPQGLLRVAGGADLAALVGFLAQAARRRTPVVLDGAATAVAALLADTDAPGARAWWVAGSRCTEPAQALALDVLGLEPLLDLQMRAGQGTGALAAVGLVRAAAAIAP
jgi:nicotinate-nucleotide--dimethylbenzimidazole phosphoribosyltransferase